MLSQWQQFPCSIPQAWWAWQLLPHCFAHPVLIHVVGKSSILGGKTSLGRSSTVSVSTEEKLHTAPQKEPPPVVERKDHVEKEGQGTTGESGHLLNLESWQHDLRPTSTKAPVLFALDRLQDILNDSDGNGKRVTELERGESKV